MKRLPAILFTLILLFNLYGYRVMLDCMQQQQEADFDARVDRNAYSNEDLISIKTPMDLPYYTNSDVYERTYGSVNVHGVDYEYVKRRVYHDTLELLCLPNKAKTDIQSTRNEFAKHALDGTPSNKKSSRLAKISMPDYWQEPKPSEKQFAQQHSQKFSVRQTAFLSSDHCSRLERPPQFV